MSNTNVDYNKRLEAFKEIYPQILEMSLAEKSPFGEFKKLLEQFGNDNVIRNDQHLPKLGTSVGKCWTNHSGSKSKYSFIHDFTRR